MKKSKLFVMQVSMAVLSTVLIIVACTEKYDHTIDTANPEIVSYNPAAAVEGVAVNSNLVLTFSENVKKGTGEILIAGSSGTISINVESDAVTIGDDKRIVTINPTDDLEADEPYTVTLGTGIVTDLVGNKFMGLAGTTWSFKTVGTSGLALSSMNPLPGSKDASLFNLSLTFAVDVLKGSGNISVFKTDGNVKVAEVPVSGQSVSIDGKTVNILLGTPLEFNTAYYVLADAGSFADAGGKAFEGFLTPGSWNFTTIAGSGNSLLVYLPMDNDLGDVSGNRFDAMQGPTATAKVTFVTDPQRGRVASFGAGSYAVLPKHNLLRPELSTSFSFSFWTKLVGIGSDPSFFGNSDWDSGGNPGFIFATDGGDTYDGTPSTGRGWLGKLTDNARIRINWRANETTPLTPALSNNQWHMVTCVVDQTAKAWHMYLDGVEYAYAVPLSLSTLTGPLWDTVNDYPFTIWEDGTGHYNANDDDRKNLAGFVDDVRVYTKALSASEVSGIYIADQK